MPLEVFTQHSTRSPRGATVTITSKGDFSLSADAHKLLAEPSHVELLFDAETQTVAFRASGADSANSYMVRQQVKSFLVSGASFTRFHAVDTSVSRRWPARLEDGLLQFSLTSESHSGHEQPQEAHLTIRH